MIFLIFKWLILFISFEHNVIIIRQQFEELCNYVYSLKDFKYYHDLVVE